MKITAGMGDLEDFRLLAEAGAEEVFTGFVPPEWDMTLLEALNRREVFFYHVNLCSYGDMKILRRMADAGGVRVSVTFNSPAYAPEHLEKIAGIIGRLCEIGFHDVIIADLSLIRYLDEHPVSSCPVRVHISGEIGEWNSALLRVLKRDYFRHGNVSFDRLIFHRKMTTEDMRSIMKTGRELFPELTYEAFILNEMCHFTGGFCNSLHCDEMAPICHLPYRLSPLPDAFRKETEADPEDEDGETAVPGLDGCGLCALYRMNQIGMDVLKLVGRGRSGEGMAEDIRVVKRALALCRESEDEAQYIRRMKEALFPDGCAGVCYYAEDRVKKCNAE